MYLELAIVCLSLIIWYVIKTRKELAALPPGGFPLPITGNIYQMVWAKVIQRKLVPVIMHEYSKKYGPISRLQFGLQRHLIIEDYDLMKEILCSEHWTTRYFDEWFGERSFGKPYGLLFSHGDEWREMRRFTLRTLRDFGFGKYSTQEGVAEEELGELMSRLNTKMEKNGNVVYMKQFFTISVLNILWSMVTGIRFSHDDDKLKKFNRTTFKVVKIASVGENLANAFPILRHMYTPFIKGSVEEMQEYFREMLREKREQKDYQNDPRDFVEVFLKEMDSHKDKNPNYYSEEQFIVLILDLFMAGSETTSNTLEFAILYMMLHPEVQHKVQQEIDTVIGSDRFPTAADRAKMPYTEATILELQRITNVVPIDGRSNTQDYKLGPYNIPKGFLAVLNLYAMHMNPDTWPEPRKFKPERFLDSENNLINGHKILPFGAGKRVCIGEPMARLTIFMYFTAFLQKYTFCPVPGKRTPSPLDPMTGVTLSPQPYSVLIKHRA